MKRRDYNIFEDVDVINNVDTLLSYNKVTGVGTFEYKFFDTTRIIVLLIVLLIGLIVTIRTILSLVFIFAIGMIFGYMDRVRDCRYIVKVDKGFNESDLDERFIIIDHPDQDTYIVRQK